MTRRSTRLFWPIVLSVLCAGYLLFVGAVSVSEGIAAVPAILAGMVVAVLHHRHVQRRFNILAPWFRLAVAIPVQLLRDSARVGGLLLCALIAPVTGRINVQPFDPGRADPTSTGRRAAVILATSLAPNAFVIRVTPDALLMHQLAPVADATDRAWPL